MVKKRILKKKIKRMIKSTLDKVGISIKVIHNKTGVNMSYDFIKHIIYFDAERIQTARLEMTVPVSLEAYVKAVTLHELGHSIDRNALVASIPKAFKIYTAKRQYPLSERIHHPNLIKIDLEEHEMNYIFEETAWVHARKLNFAYKVLDSTAFDKVKFDCMLSYIAQYNRDLLIYQRLLNKRESHDFAI